MAALERLSVNCGPPPTMMGGCRRRLRWAAKRSVVKKFDVQTEQPTKRTPVSAPVTAEKYLSSETRYSRKYDAEIPRSLQYFSMTGGKPAAGSFPESTACTNERTKGRSGTSIT